MAQLQDHLLQAVRTRVLVGRPRVPQKAVVKMEILREAHRTPYMVHLGETKMYQDLKQRGGSG